jgi:hypothetical protein
VRAGQISHKHSAYRPLLIHSYPALLSYTLRGALSHTLTHSLIHPHHVSQVGLDCAQDDRAGHVTAVQVGGGISEQRGEAAAGGRETMG